jgi:predicted negative regulator of RcsB-dependent stress response
MNQLELHSSLREQEMVDEYLTDDEQAEALKSWWRENWAWVFSGIVLGVCLLSGWSYYQRHTAQKSEAAAKALEDFATAQANDTNKAQTLFKELTEKYAATPYAIQAQLLQAQDAVGNNDLPKAEAALRVVIADSKDAELTQIAKYRLARVLIEQGKSDDALALLDVAKSGAFAAEVHEIRGDALYAKQDTAGARGEYESALAAYKADGQTDVALLEYKLQDLGGPVAVAEATVENKVSAK